MILTLSLPVQSVAELLEAASEEQFVGMETYNTLRNEIKAKATPDEFSQIFSYNRNEQN